MSFWSWITSLFLKQTPSVAEEIESQATIQEANTEKNKDPDTIAEVAKTLVIYEPSGGMAEYRTIKNIRDYVNQIMIYKKYYWPRTIENIWNDKYGDCTDYSRLIEELAIHVGIRCHRAHGYSSGEKHDWLVYDGNIIDGTGRHENYEYIGEGFW